jgi:oligopeptide/dipeptide ABC transporter ATP-binding protein
MTGPGMDGAGSPRVDAALADGAGTSGIVLEVRDLHVRIASRRGTVRAVDGVSFDVAPGEALGLVGESGSGKSMTLRAVLGLLPPEARVTSGQVLLDGVDLLKVGQSQLNRIRGPKMSMIFQEPMSALNPVMRVGPQIAEGPQVQLGYSRARSAEKALELMRRVGIPDPERRFRAYPPHDLPVVAQLCQRVAVMYGGQLVERGGVSEVLLEPRHPYTRGLVRSAPDFDYVRESLVPIPGSPPSLVTPPPGCRFHPRCEFAEEDCLPAL